ncbi:MAG: sugar transferase, partial [Kiritimatiellales bacterium]
MSKISRRSLFLRQLPDSLLLVLSDSTVLFMALFFGKLLIHWLFGVPLSIKYSLIVIPVWWGGAAVAGLLPGWGLGAVEEIRRIEMSLLALFTLAAMAYFFTREHVMPSRIVYAGCWGFSAVAMPVSRWAVRAVLMRFNRWGCPVAIYGRPEHAAALITALKQSPELGYTPAAVFTEGETSICGVPVMGGFKRATPNLAVAAVSLPSFSSPELTQLIDHTLSGISKVILFPDMHGGIFMSVRSRSFGSVIGLEVASNLLNPFARLFKRAFDLTVVLITAPFWTVFCAALIPLVWLPDRAAPFYTQTRMGKDGQPFRMIKFRTMVPDAELCLEAALEKDPALRAEWELYFKLKKDPRITPAGRLLRRF